MASVSKVTVLLLCRFVPRCQFRDLTTEAGSFSCRVGEGKRNAPHMAPAGNCTKRKVPTFVTTIESVSALR